MLVVATDAPLDARDLRRLAARANFGLARTGSSYSNGSGDFAIAFSTSPDMRSRFNETAARAHVILPVDATSPLFQAALEATEEAVTLPLPGDDRALGERHGRSDPHRPRARAVETLTNDEGPTTNDQRPMTNDQ